MIYIFGGITGGIGKELSKLCGASPVGRHECDLEKEETIKEFFEIRMLVGITPVHIVNSIGVSINSMIHKSKVEDIEKILRVNLTANFLLIKHARDIWKKRGGSLTILSSVCADTGPVGTAAYTSSKAAIRGFVRVASRELAPFARCNAIELGYTDMGIINQVPDLEKVIETIPLKRLGTAADVVKAVRFCIECEYLTGACIKVNGGLA